MNDYIKDFKNYAVKHKGIGSLMMENYVKMTSRVITPTAMTPNVIEERQMNVIAMSVFDRLMMDRIIFLGLPIDSMVANVVNAQLLFLESVDKNKDIWLYINSPGGEIYAGNGILDCMDFIKPDVATTNVGIAASMAFVIAINGHQGKRFALKRSRFLQHQPMGGAEGQASDIEITARQIMQLKKELYETIAEKTGQPLKRITKDCDRDYWMTAKEALDYGCIDKIL